MSLRTAFAVALAALVAFPAAATARTRRGATRSITAAAPAPAASSEPPQSPPARAVFVGATVGVEFDRRFTGLALSMDAEMKLGRLTPVLALSAIGSVGYSYFSRDAVGIDTSWNLLKLMPAARLTWTAAPRLGVYGEAGVGGYYGRYKSTWSFPTYGERTSNDLGLLMRFGAGGLYDLGPRARLNAGISGGRYFGDVHATTWILGVGATVGI